MPGFTPFTAPAFVLNEDDVDTDIIFPARFLLHTERKGLGRFAFHDRPALLEAYEGAGKPPILLAGANFGCGSSREHAVWALAEYGFRVVIAPSFSPIFQGNCIRNGIAPIVLPREVVERIAGGCAAGTPVVIDMPACEVRMSDAVFPFTMEDEARTMLIEGADAIELTLRHRDRIEAFFERDKAVHPWIYLGD